jgi:hypothetical protein
MMKNKYEGAGGQFTTEASRIIPILASGEKRKMPDGGHDNYIAHQHGSQQQQAIKAPLGMWDAFGDDIARFGYSDTKDMFVDSTSGGIPKP